MRDTFVAAIHSKSKIQITFFSQEDQRNLTRVCAPMDFGPKRNARDKSDRFHMWDFESDKQNHILSLLPEKVISIVVLPQHFDPAEFVTWQPNWFVKRNWGRFS